MCGIIAYTGKRNATTLLVEGLHALEYRGYDSSGIFIPGAGVVRAVGPVDNLEKKIPTGFTGTSGIAHTRWATHGEPLEKNAHPHADDTGRISLVHNGIIENYKELKTMLAGRGHQFASDTDSEVIAHLIAETLKTTPKILDAMMIVLKELRGTYGLAVVDTKEPEKIIAARMGSPLIIGVGVDENFIASDATPLMQHTKNVVYLNDGEVAVLTPNAYKIYTLEQTLIDRLPDIIDFNIEEITKGGYEHFMLKEMMEAPEVVRNTLRGRLIVERGMAKLGGLIDVAEKLKNIKRIIIVGCGTAYYAALVGEYMLEEYAGIPVEVEIASEFRYRSPVIDKDTVLLAVSQSGETADTIEAIREAKRKGALTLGIVNVVGSTIARETDAGVYNHAGPEIGVASTKAFISQLIVLSLFTLYLGRQRSMTEEEGKSLVQGLLDIPAKLDEILHAREEIKILAERYSGYRDFMFIGRKYNYPSALEGALKLKEISYIHAEGYGAGEMKHGPLAMIDELFPTVALLLKDSVYEKMISNVTEVRARKGPVLALATVGDKDVEELVSDVFFIPETKEMLSPILAAVPLQLFAYYIASLSGKPVDKPRNLAKSVTVE